MRCVSFASNSRINALFNHFVAQVQDNKLPRVDFDAKFKLTAVGTDRSIDVAINASAIPVELDVSTSTLEFHDCDVGQTDVRLSKFLIVGRVS